MPHPPQVMFWFRFTRKDGRQVWLKTVMTPGERDVSTGRPLYLNAHTWITEELRPSLGQRPLYVQKKCMRSASDFLTKPFPHILGQVANVFCKLARVHRKVHEIGFRFSQKPFPHVLGEVNSHACTAKCTRSSSDFSRSPALIFLLGQVANVFCNSHACTYHL